MKVSRGMAFVNDVWAYDIDVHSIYNYARGWRRLHPDKKIRLNMVESNETVEYVY